MFPFLLLLSVVVLFAQMFLGEVPATHLWLNWGISGGLGLALFEAIDRFRMGRTMHRGLMIIPWLLMAVTLNLGATLFPQADGFGSQKLILSGFVVVFLLSLGGWQQTQSTVHWIGFGLVLGLLAAFYPQAIEWLLFLPAALFQMRSLTVRNLWAALTGLLSGLWVDFCWVYFVGEPDGWRQFFLPFHNLVDVISVDFLTFSVWQWIYVGSLLTLWVSYMLLGLFSNPAGSLRAHASAVLTAHFMLCLLVLSVLNLSDIPLMMACGMALLGMRMMLGLANSRSMMAKWWTFLLLFVLTCLQVLPLVWPWLIACWR